MPKSSTTVESFVSPEEFRDIVIAVDKYPEFLPEVKKVEIKERTEDALVAKFFVEVKVAGDGSEDRVRRCATRSGKSEVSWSLLESPTLTKNEGRWKLEETADGETKAFYENELVTTLPIPEELQKVFADQELPRMMQRFRDRAEG